MRLYEYEAKELLRAFSLETPLPLSVSLLEKVEFSEPCVLKAQTLYGNRAEKGLIQLCRSKEEFLTAVATLRKALVKNEIDEAATSFLVEPLVDYTNEMYIAVRYDTRTRLPVLYFSEKGGTGIEDRGDLRAYPLLALAKTPLPDLHEEIPRSWIEQLITAFLESDATLIEVNPLVFVNGRPVALDGKIELDDTAAFRHSEWEKYPARTLFPRQPTENELAAKTVNAMDHRGVAGASYFDFTGSIGVLASGGGASLLAMDALLASSLSPANYTEYSGNPPREKVKALADIVLSKPQLEGLWVIGGHANFTDIYETLMGVMDAVEAAHLPKGFPIVVRRGGPRMEEAFTELEKRAKQGGFNIAVFDSEFPITDTVAVLEKAVEKMRKS